MTKKLKIGCAYCKGLIPKGSIHFYKGKRYCSTKCLNKAKNRETKTQRLLWLIKENEGNN